MPLASSSSARRTSLVALAAVGLAASVAGPAAAAGATSPEQGTWVRAAHLVPGLHAMAFTITPAEGGASVVVDEDAGYGEVSTYEQLPAGEYRVDVRDADDPSASPALTGTFELAPGAATTLAGLGTTADPRLATLTDDLTPPAAGSANVRLVNAAAGADQVDVGAVDGPTIAEGAVFGQPTPYATVPAGRWQLRVSSGDRSDEAVADVASGGVYTVFVLGEDGEELSLLPVVDAAGTTVAPEGAPATGTGALPTEGSGTAAVLGGTAAVSLAAASLLLLRRRTTS